VDAVTSVRAASGNTDLVRGPGMRGRVPSRPRAPCPAWAVRCPTRSLWSCEGGADRRRTRCPRARRPIATPTASWRVVLQCLLLRGFCQCSVPQREGAAAPSGPRARVWPPLPAGTWRSSLVPPVPVSMEGLRSSHGYWVCRRTRDRRSGRWPRCFDTRSSAMRPRSGGRPLSGALTAEPVCHVRRKLMLRTWWTAPSTAGWSGAHVISRAVCGRRGSERPDDPGAPRRLSCRGRTQALQCTHRPQKEHPIHTQRRASP
jgi:hypothetical protein